MKCDFCGREFHESNCKSACSKCSPGGSCGQIKCPYCGYGIPKEAGLVRFLRKWLGQSRPVDAKPEKAKLASLATGDVLASGCLADGKVGMGGVVCGMLTEDRHEVRKLFALGILPGASIQLIRRFPAFVLQLGYSQFTMDHQLAEKISVQWNSKVSS
jgi:Fe2+ transport system protein FeoA